MVPDFAYFYLLFVSYESAVLNKTTVSVVFSLDLFTRSYKGTIGLLI